MLAILPDDSYHGNSMTTPEQFRAYDQRQFSAYRMIGDFKEQRQKREKEFSKEIGGRALRLMRAFGIDSRDRWVRHDDGYSVSTTVTHSEVKEFDNQGGARLHITRESLSFMTGGIKLGASYLTRTGIGPITKIRLDYIDKHESVSSVKLERHEYGDAFPVESQGYAQICTTYEKVKDSFMQQLELVEYQTFPR